MHKLWFSFSFFFLFNNFVVGQNDTIKLYYDIGIYKLDKVNYAKIQNKIEQLNDSLKYHVQIISSCDFLGTNKKNLTLSSKRATIVRDLLVLKDNVTITSIKYKGIGERSPKGLSLKKEGIPDHRITHVIFKTESQIIFDKMATSKTGDIFTLQNIVFDPGRHLFKKKSIPIIRDLLKVLQENPSLEIEINGHICCGKNPKDSLDGFDKDTKTYNLSENRAKHIYNYLTMKNIESSRLIYKGQGFLHPLKFPELSKKDKANNRRVEIKILKN